MAAEHALYVGRKDLVPVEKCYHTLDSALYVHEAVLIHLSYIAAVYPRGAVGMGLYHVIRLALIVEIAEHYRRAAYAYLALLAVTELLCRAGFEYAHSRRQQRISYGKALEIAVAAAGCGRGDLTHAVAL